MMTISQILLGQYQIWNIFGFWGKNKSMMEIMDKGLTMPKWGLIVLPKIPKNLFCWSARFAQKFGIYCWKKDSSDVRSTYYNASVGYIPYRGQRGIMDVQFWYFRLGRNLINNSSLKIFISLLLCSNDLKQEKSYGPSMKTWNKLDLNVSPVLAENS